VLAYDIHNLLSVKNGHEHGLRYVERWGRLIYVRPEELNLHVKGSYSLSIHGFMETRDGVPLTLPTTATSTALPLGAKNLHPTVSDRGSS
jgi:hypothetical protein